MQACQGIVVINKPKGMTSHDCVNKIRKLAKTKKVGHTGTLDPEVTGVLPICIGQATRVAEYLLDYDKEYLAEITLGRLTSTLDQTGEVIVDQPVEVAPSKAQLEEVLAGFKGVINQVPPMYSALKINGKKLYELAREGKEIERKARQVSIYDLELIDYTSVLPYPTCTIRVRCSKGTYIRTLAQDIGAKLGLPAYLTSLIRTVSGPFDLQQAYTLEEIETWNEEDWLHNIHPLDSALVSLPAINLSWEERERVSFGQSLVLNQEVEQDQLYRLYDPHGGFIAIYSGEQPHLIRPKKVFLR